MSPKDYNKLTDPYGSLEFAIGSADDFWCFDYYVHENGDVTLHAVINSETGSFIMDAEEPIRVSAAQAVEQAKRLTDAAIDWCYDSDEPIEHDTEGWNQDPSYFWRAVQAAVTGQGRPVVCIEAEQVTMLSEEDLDWQARNQQEGK
jgi:hypothetical protein